MNIGTIKAFFLSAGYVLVLILYLANELNKTTVGTIIDSFWLTGLSVMYIVYMIRFTGIRIVESYFTIRQAEYSPRIYKVLGVTLFKKALQRSPFPGMTRKITLRDISEEAIRSLEKEMKEAEETHVFGFALNIGLAILFGTLRNVSFVFWLTDFNFVMNLYPILLQRYNRNRITILLKNRYLR